MFCFRRLGGKNKEPPGPFHFISNQRKKEKNGSKYADISGIFFALYLNIRRIEKECFVALYDFSFSYMVLLLKHRDIIMTTEEGFLSKFKPYKKKKNHITLQNIVREITTQL